MVAAASVLMFTGNQRCCHSAVLTRPRRSSRTVTLDTSLVRSEDDRAQHPQELTGSNEENIDDDEEEKGEFSYGLAENNELEEQQRSEARLSSSRDAFFALNPEPRRQHAERNQQQRQRKWGRKKKQRIADVDEQDEDGVTSSNQEMQQRKEPLRDSKSILTLASADILNSTLLTSQANSCRGDLFKHRIRVPGCLPKIIVNRFCHGSCSSFYIPRLRSKKLKATFQSCAACVPVETDLVKVRLNCPDRNEQDNELYRTVVRVKRCACRNIVLEGDENDAASVDNDQDTPNNDDITVTLPNEDNIVL